MARLTLAEAIAEIRATLDAVADIRRVHISEPNAVNHPPEAYIAAIDIGHVRATTRADLYRDLADVTLRVLLSRADADDAETDSYALQAGILAAFRPGMLSDGETNCEPLRSSFGYVTVGESPSNQGTRYRALDVVIQLEMFRTT